MTATASRGGRDQIWLGYLRRCAEGDTTALSNLYDESSRYVYGMALRILHDTADAEEVTIDVFSQVWRSAGSFAAQRGSVLSWLVTLTRSRAIDRLRTQTAKVRRKEETLDSQFALRDEADNPEESATLEQERRRIRAALDQLSPEQREPLELAFFGGLSHSELAARLNQPLGTVKTRIRLGMIKMRELLEVR
jgi:RNA polymerase sigma-70 factor, ECF subfamily